MLRAVTSNLTSDIKSLLTAKSAFLQQNRTTFILKRLYPVEQFRKNQMPRKLRGKHFNYVLVEDRNIIKKPDLKVVLTKYVEGIGKKGDVVSLRPNAAYKNLLLPGLAVYHTPENVEKYRRTESDEEDFQPSSQNAQRTVNCLQNRVYAVVMNLDEPWVIEPWHIRVSLRKCAIYVPDEAIELPAEKITGPDLRKQNKEFNVVVTINNKEKANVRFRIHHWATDPSQRLPYVPYHWLEEAEPLFASN